MNPRGTIYFHSTKFPKKQGVVKVTCRECGKEKYIFAHYNQQFCNDTCYIAARKENDKRLKK